MARYRKGDSVKRLSIAVREDTLTELDRLVLESGVYRSYFFAAALVLGARLLSQVYSPDKTGVDVSVFLDGDVDSLRDSLVHESVSTKGSKGGDKW